LNILYVNYKFIYGIIIHFTESLTPKTAKEVRTIFSYEPGGNWCMLSERRRRRRHKPL